MHDVVNHLHRPTRDRDVRDRIREHVMAIAGNDLTGVLLFGSRARGDARDDSDWDVAVLVRDQADLPTLNKRLSLALSADDVLWDHMVQPVILRPIDMVTAWELVRNLEVEAVAL